MSGTEATIVTCSPSFCDPRHVFTLPVLTIKNLLTHLFNFHIWALDPCTPWMCLHALLCPSALHPSGLSTMHVLNTCSLSALKCIFILPIPMPHPFTWQSFHLMSYPPSMFNMILVTHPLLHKQYTFMPPVPPVMSSFLTGLNTMHSTEGISADTENTS